MKHFNKPRKQNFAFWIIVLVLILLTMSFMIMSSHLHDNRSNVPPTQLTYEMKHHEIKHMTIQPNDGVYHIHGTYNLSRKQKREVKEQKRVIRTFTAKDLETDSTTQAMINTARKNHVRYSISAPKKPNPYISSIIVTVIPLLLFFILIYYMIKHINKGGGLTSIGKKNYKPINSKHDRVRFKDVAGEDAEKQELVEVVDFLKHPKKYSRLGAKIPHGVLLEGPPGTGKTLLAKAVAGEAGVPFYQTSGSDFVQKFVGVGAGRVRQLFKRAKRHAPSIIFIDEIDAIGRRRGNNSSGAASEQEQTLNQLLVEMNGFTSNQDVIVIGATNRADVLDPALTRPGRFDRKIRVDLPDVRGRRAILAVHAKGKKFSKWVDFDELARQTPSFSGADLANVLNEAALLAARYNHKLITKKDVDVAVDRTMLGPAKKHAVMNKHDRHIIADHEAGHTIVGMVLNDALKVHKVTIIPRGRAGGYTRMLPKDGQVLLSRKGMLEELAGLLGGRSAEELIYHQRTSGASSDLSRATKLARQMVTQYGMTDKIGDVVLQSPFSTKLDCSSQTAFDVDKTINTIITHAHHVALKVLKAHKKQHHDISQALLKYESLDVKELSSLFKTGHMPKNDPKVIDAQKHSKTTKK